MRQRKDVVAGDASLGGCISGAVGGRYGLRGIYRGSYPSRITQTGRPERGRLRGDIRLCGAVGVEKPSQAIGRVQVERGRPIRLPQRRLPERQLRGPSDVDGDAGNAESEGCDRGAAGDSAPGRAASAVARPPAAGTLPIGSAQERANRDNIGHGPLSILTRSHLRWSTHVFVRETLGWPRDVTKPLPMLAPWRHA
jgi:hypothetical protein